MNGGSEAVRCLISGRSMATVNSVIGAASDHFGFCVVLASVGFFESGRGSRSARRYKTCPPGILIEERACEKVGPIDDVDH